MTISDIIAKRKRAWNNRHDIKYDQGLVAAAVQEILGDSDLVLEIKAKPYLLIELAFTIVDKDRKTVPFFYNEVQADFIEKIEKYGTTRPYFVLKGRQQGFTSLITAIQLCYAIVMKNFAGFTVADCGDNTLAIFNDKARMPFDRLCDLLKPTTKFNSRNELFFDKLNSSWRIATATEQVGRSRTLNFAHFSEVAFYEVPLASLQKGIGEALVKDAFVVYETTANGYNEAKDLWDSGACVNLFYEWWRSCEYRIEDTSGIAKAEGWLAERVELLREKGLDENQIAWYCDKYNGYIDKDTIKQEYPISHDEAFVSSGACAFDKDKVIDQIERVKDLQAVKKGYFKYRKRAIDVDEFEITDIEWVDDDKNGYITIHNEPYVERDTVNREVITRKAPYAIGGDTAGLGEDYFTAKVVNSINEVCAATMRVQRIDDDLYADQVYCLGWYYHWAIVGIEVNYSLTATRELEKLGYPNMYKREIMDTTLGKTVTVHKPGFLTDERTRKVIVEELVRKFRQNPQIEVDAETLAEFLVFCKNKVGKYCAILGKHDDLVMADAIAHYIIKQGTVEMIENIDDEDTFLENWHLNDDNGNGGFNLWD